jgi:ABC-type Zn uptake system ZnuABC Zn-binding protein ZnuA
MFCHQKHRLFYLFPLLLSFALGCAKMPDPWLEVPGKLKVLVSFPPLYSMVKSIAGDRAAVISLCTTTGPHDYAFNAKDTILLRKADLFFYNGRPQPWQFRSAYLAWYSPKPSYDQCDS